MTFAEFCKVCAKFAFVFCIVFFVVKTNNLVNSVDFCEIVLSVVNLCKVVWGLVKMCILL